jgi:ABC-type lipoprotein release transport system permease subunit
VAAGRVISGLLFGIAPIHAPTIAMATILMAMVALAAAIIPAWRASSVSPLEALHAE